MCRASMITYLSALLGDVAEDENTQQLRKFLTQRYNLVVQKSPRAIGF